MPIAPTSTFKWWNNAKSSIVDSWHVKFKFKLRHRYSHTHWQSESRETNLEFHNPFTSTLEVVVQWCGEKDLSVKDVQKRVLQMWKSSVLPIASLSVLDVPKVGHIAENCSSEQRLCYNCRQPGHESSACSSPRSVSSKQCYSCGGVGESFTDLSFHPALMRTHRTYSG